MFDIGENLKQLPDEPGVYLHKDKDGEIIYVGKASSLRSRVRQYFRERGRDAKTAALASHISEFEYIVTKTEAEALLLENTLIKRHSPRYNVMLRDDKTYPYIKITLGEKWPRLLKTRVLKSDGSKYFGPYADVGAVNRIIALLNDVYRLKRCRYSSFPAAHRACLHGHIDRCRRMCEFRGKSKASECELMHSEYMDDISRIISFLKGHGAGIEKFIIGQMEAASDRMDYEDAARWRDYLESARAVTEKQRVELLSSGSMDVVLASRGAEESAGVVMNVTVFFVRDGKLMGRERHRLDSGANSALPDTVAAFLSQYYSNQSQPPGEILLENHIPDEQLISDALSGGAGYKVRIIVPMRGAKRELVKLAQNDVAEAGRREHQRIETEKKNRENLRKQLDDIFGDFPGTGAEHSEGAPPPPLRVEAYDISHTGGADSVGAMVVFTDGAPDKSAYRRFKIRGDEKGDDYAAMQEVLYRRLKRGIDGDKSFLPMPGLILIDGGKGHVSAARQMLDAMPAVNVRLAGMVKDDSHRSRGLVTETADGTGFAETDLTKKRELFRLIGAIQEEVHRFAIEYHRKRRDKSMLGKK